MHFGNYAQKAKIYWSEKTVAGDEKHGINWSCIITCKPECLRQLYCTSLTLLSTLVPGASFSSDGLTKTKIEAQNTAARKALAALGVDMSKLKDK